MLNYDFQVCYLTSHKHGICPSTWLEYG